MGGDCELFTTEARRRRGTTIHHKVAKNAKFPITWSTITASSVNRIPYLNKKNKFRVQRVVGDNVDLRVLGDVAVKKLYNSSNFLFSTGYDLQS